MSALGAPDGNGPGGTFTLDPETFDVKGRWELDRGPQQLAYDMWWHLGLDTMVTSSWGTPNMVKDGVNPELLLGGKYGNTLHVWDLRRRRHVQELSLGPEQQMTLELRRTWHKFHVPAPSDSGDVQLRLAVKPESGPMIDILTFDFPVVQPTSTTLRFRWGTVVVPLARARRGCRLTLSAEARLPEPTWID